jgi:hypothetical protein
MSGASLRANTTGPELPAPLPRVSGEGSTAEESFHDSIYAPFGPSPAPVAPVVFALRWSER